MSRWKSPRAGPSLETFEQSKAAVPAETPPYQVLPGNAGIVPPWSSTRHRKRAAGRKHFSLNLGCGRAARLYRRGLGIVGAICREKSPDSSRRLCLPSAVVAFVARRPALA